MLTFLSLCSCALTLFALLTPNFSLSHGIYRNPVPLTDDYGLCAKILAALYAGLGVVLLYWFRGVGVASRLAVGGKLESAEEDDGR